MPILNKRDYTIGIDELCEVIAGAIKDGYNVTVIINGEYYDIDYQEVNDND